MAGNDRQAGRDFPLEDVQIRPADPAGFDSQQNLAFAGLGLREILGGERTRLGWARPSQVLGTHLGCDSDLFCLSAMSRIDALLSDYASFHRTRGNLVCHAIGITFILYGVLALLLEIRLPVPPWTAAEVLIVAVVLYDLRLNAALALTMFAEAALFDLLARAVGDWRVGVAAFGAGWLFQAIGHAGFEKNRPAFFRSAVHLLVGPLFLWNELLRVRPVPRT